MSNRYWRRVGPKLAGWIVSAIVVLFAGLALARMSGVASVSRAAPSAGITIDQIVASGLSNPVHVTHAGDGSGRLFVVEQPGRIRIIKNGVLLGTPFLNITDRVLCCGERGLLSVAFSPSYGGNGYLYVNYTRKPDGATVVSRFRVTLNPDVAAAASEQIVLTVAQPYANHNGGQIAFSPTDGYLYIGMGDGGSGGDPQKLAQNPAELLGKLLRIDVETGQPLTYTIPATNPFTQAAGYRGEIWALGLRNPWRFAFDRANGDVYIGDVGQNLWEEIDYQAAGQGGLNFGWRCREGTHTYTTEPPCNDPALLATFTAPIAEYNHSDGQSVTGGAVYRGALYPALVGRYYYADYVQGKIWSVRKTGSNPDTWSVPVLELDTGITISSFGEGEDGELYVCDYGGTVRRLADVNGPSPNLTTSTKRAEPAAADPGEVLTFSIRLLNTGGLANATAWLTDVIPVGLTYVPGSLTATRGAVNDISAPTLYWNGALTPDKQITLTYRVTATGAVTGSLVNTARLTSAAFQPITLTSAVFVPRSVFTSTHRDFILPGTQPNQLRAEIRPPMDCDICHSAPIYDKWRGSLMGQAGRDPLMWAALAAANHDAPGSGEFCLRCHTPSGWLAGRSHMADGSTLQPDDIAAGVSCALCHRLVDVVPSTGDEAAPIDAQIRQQLQLSGTLPITTHVGSAMMIVDPDDNRRGPFALGSTFAYHTAKQTDLFNQSSQAVTRSRVCGTCHNVENPALAWDAARGQFWPNQADQPAPSVDTGQLFPIETTYEEWRKSQFAATGVLLRKFAGAKPDGVVRACQDCHMTRATGQAADAQFNPMQRDCATTGCLPVHDLVGGNTWTPQLLQDGRWRLNAASESSYLNDTVSSARQMLRKAATLTATLAMSGSDKVALVRVTNDTGHKLPTGYAEGRRMWINVQARDAGGNVIYESGAYNPATAVLTHDAQARVYEVLQGITPELAALVKLPPGASFHFVLNNTVVKDNRIPPRGYTQAAFDTPGLRPIGAAFADGQYWDDVVYTVPTQTTSVLATLYYQTSSKEYIDFLRRNGGVDGETLGRLWDTIKSPPEVMAVAWSPGWSFYLPIVLR